tara:strand:+ start:18651 stop:18998 length:348 start_codon:yes stop_codon:yes gene_type:complete
MARRAAFLHPAGPCYLLHFLSMFDTPSYPPALLCSGPIDAAEPWIVARCLAGAGSFLSMCWNSADDVMPENPALESRGIVVPNAATTLRPRPPSFQLSQAVFPAQPPWSSCSVAW